ncbi:hypothetical protein BH23GEM6_BH23GEM6_13120 [soil metagenome]
MRIFATVLFLVAVGHIATDPAYGQFPTDPLNAGQSLAEAFGGELPATPISAFDYNSPTTVLIRPSLERVVIGTTVGAIIGGAAGLGVVAMTRGEPADGNMLPWGDLAAGTVLGSIPGMYLGARIASGRQGNPWLTGAAAVGGTALGLIAGAAIGGLLAQADTGKAPEVIGLAIAVAIPVGVTSWVESRTAR